MEKILKIEGMMCPHCEARVKKCLEELPEVKEAVVSHEKDEAVVILEAEISDETLKSLNQKFNNALSFAPTLFVSVGAVYLNEENEEKIMSIQRFGVMIDCSRNGVLFSDKITDRLAEHGRNDQCVDDTNNAEDRHFKCKQRTEQKKDQASEEQNAADDIIKLLHFLHKAIGDDKANVTERKGRRADDEIVTDQIVTEECQHKTCRHTDIEFGTRLFGFQRISKIEKTKQGKRTAAYAFERKVKAA